jgi:uncharacterized protein YfaS (alpha-2-macroglobulin family)
MFISFILENPELVITKDYPIKISVKDSRGTKRYSETSTNHSGGLYVFKVPTEHTDPTGNWNATIIVGENKFYKSLKVETIKPNRLKIDVVQEGKGEIDISRGRSDFQFSSNWLHGAPAKNLRAKVECQFTQRSLSFKDHPEYNFMDYTAGLDSRVFTGFDAKLNEKGEGQFSLKRPPTNTIKSKLNANFKIRVFEESGNTSEDHFSVSLNPFSHYAGISLAKTSWYSQSYGLGSKQTFKVLSVDKSGKTSSSRKLSVGVYKNSDHWWYRQNARNNYSYANGKHVGATHEFDLTTDGQGEAEVKFDCKDAGSFTVRVCDSETGHCSSSRFYVRNYYDDTELSYENRTEISKIFLSADKDDYNTGETAQIKIPSYLGAKILVSLETQDRILYQEWIEGKEKETIYSLRCTEDMAPNVYVNVNIIQAHGQSVNNMPIRMYGVLPIKVYDKKTKLIPEIEMADVIEPLEKYSVTISEENNREMHYTLAVVDEGLLDLTNYNTPDPFNHFYAKQSLLLKTWDNFDMILNGFGSELSRVLTIGGDGESAESKPPKKANRFKPVVSFLGPYHLKAGKKVRHELTMDNYVGSVKVMVVARDKSSFGKADKQVPVKKPLMILATAPRVIGPEEQFTLPVNVFAMDSKIKDVEVTMEAEEQFSITDGTKKNVSFNEVGDQLVNFNLSVKDLVGIGKIKITATSGAESMTQEIEIDIRNPNPYISDVLDKVIAPESEWDSSFVLIGVEGTNEAVLELSTFPAIDFDRRLKYLIRYPYGCLEQTTSSAFPQLFMENVAELTDAQKKQMQYNVEKAIRRIGRYKLNDGSLSYWIGENQRANWAFTYAIHFLVEAKKAGYYVPNDLIDEAVIALKKEVKTLDINALWSKREKGNYWSNESSFFQMHFTNQAYSLYVLSLVNEAVFPAMNLLNAENKLNRTASAFLAGAYQNSGKSSIASELLTKHSEGSWYEPYHSYSYGSELRNKSVACLVLNNMDRKEEAAKLAIQIANSLGSTRWHSTQSTAFGLMAVSKFLGESKREPLSFVIDLGNGQQKTITTDKPVFHYKLDQKEMNAKKVFVKNLNKNNLFSRLILSGQPAKNINESYEKGLSMSVAYKDENGLSLNPAEITQGLDFYAYVTIKNKSNQSYLNNLALSQVFPSGWEIMNTRMDKFTEDKNDRLRYQDFRDDRVYSFFNLGSQSLLIKLKLNASYPGEYYLPDLFCEAMYDNEIQARIAGQKVRVLPRLN